MSNEIDEFVEAFDNVCDSSTRPALIISTLIEFVSVDNYWLKSNITKQDIESLKKCVKDWEK